MSGVRARAASVGWTVGLLAVAPPAASGSGVRFLVSETIPNVGDSYVLVLHDPDDIAHARAIVEDPAAIVDRIIYAKIAPGADGVNRDLLAPGGPAWSWRITEFDAFYANVPEIYDAWPGYIEANLDEWIDDTGGYIGFWTYTVSAELGPVACIPNLNGDGAVDSADLNLLLTQFGCEGVCGPADTNGDGAVDSADLNLLLAEFGQVCG